MSDITVSSQVPASAVLVAQVTLDDIDRLAEEAAKVTVATVQDRTLIAEPLYAKVHAISKAIELRRVALKAPALDYERAIDAAAKDAQSVLKPTLDALGSLIQAQLAREEAERQAEHRRALAEAEAKQKAEIAKADMAAAFAGGEDDVAAVVEHLPERVAMPKAPPPPRSSAIQKRTEYVLVIVDAKLVPIEVAGAVIRPIDEATAKRLMRTGVKIDGLRLDAVQTFGSKGSR